MGVGRMRLPPKDSPRWLWLIPIGLIVGGFVDGSVG